MKKKGVGKLFAGSDTITIANHIQKYLLPPMILYPVAHPTNEPAIICYVVKKKPKGELRKEDIVPEELEGVQTDVVESGDIRAL